MEAMTVSNGQMCFSCWNLNFTGGYNWAAYTSLGFVNQRRPIRGFPLHPQSSNKRFDFRIRADSNGDRDGGVVAGALLDNDFEFKRSFDEYLKAMESVKTVREKKPLPKLSGRKLMDDSERNSTASLERTEIIENDELRNSKETRVRESGAKFSVKTSSGDSNVKKSARGAKRGALMSDQRTRSMDAELNLDQDYSKKKQSLQRIPAAVGDVRRNKNRRSSPEGEEVVPRNNNMSHKVGRKQVQIDESSDEEFLVKEGLLSRRNQGRVEENSDILLSRRNQGRVEENSDILLSRRNQGRVEENSDMEFIEKKGSLSRRNQVLFDSGDAEGLEVERAAFKSLEEYNNIASKPRSKMEIEERIQKLAQSLNGADIDMPEWMFSKMMRSARIKYTDHSIVRIIQILGKFGNWRRVLQVIEWLQMRERFKSHRLRYIYTTALNVLGKAQRPVEALNVFHAMQQQMSTYPDLVAYHCIAVVLGQAGHMEQLFDVIDSMRSPPKKKSKRAVLDKWDPRMEPDIVVFNAVLNACVQRKQWEGAFWVIQQLKQQGIKPSTATYGLIMEVMFSSGKYNLVHEFFRKVQKSSMPNALVYRVLVNTLWKEGKIDEAVLAVQDMEKRGIVGSAALYYDLARCLCSVGRCQEALLQIEKICKVANKPLVVTYTGLIQACLDGGNIQNAVYIFNHMTQFCSPNLVTCNIMLKAYVEHGLFEEAKELFHKMTDDEIRVLPDIYSFNLILEACVAEERWDDFEYFYERMLYHGFHFNKNRHLRLILDASRAGKGKALEMTWKRMAATNRTLPTALIKERFCLMLEKDDIKSAVECVTSNDTTTGPLEISSEAWLSLLKENGERFSRDGVVKLMWEVSEAIDRSTKPDPVLRNLFTSCNDFLRIRSRLVRTKLDEQFNLK